MLFCLSTRMDNLLGMNQTKNDETNNNDNNNKNKK